MLGTNPLESYSSTIRHVLHSRSKYSYRFDSTQMDPSVLRGRAAIPSVVGGGSARPSLRREDGLGACFP
jgi:hypothetical protein